MEQLNLNIFQKQIGRKSNNEFSKKIIKAIKKYILLVQDKYIKKFEINPQNLSKEVIRQQLQADGYPSYKLGKVLYQNDLLYDDRFRFGETYANWKIGQWNKVFFTDECVFNIKQIGEISRIGHSKLKETVFFVKNATQSKVFPN